MALHRTQSDLISKMQQTLAKIDDGTREAAGFYMQADRLCEFETLEDGTWQPKRDPITGAFAMLVTDDELRAANFDFTAQELGGALFGVIEFASNIPAELGAAIGKVRA